ncbi:MAG: hypothetical protein K6F59_02890 [Gammaproteobacteria bacterium]|nr:hypothetical protein [Gammaproteobacteria bacterium]
MQLKKDEFNNFSKEENAPISEYKQFEAIEYYKTDEIRKVSKDINDTPAEHFNDSKVVDNSVSSDTSFNNKTKEKEEIEKLEKSSETTSSSTTSNTAEQAGQAAESTAATTSTAASTSAASTSVAASTSATVAGGSLVAALAAATVAIAGGSFATAPTITNPKFESGTDYIKLSMELSDLDEGANYFVRLKGNDYEAVFPVEEEGLIEEICTGLIPNRKYTVTVYSKSGELLEFQYETYNIFTSKLEQPEAIYKVNENVDYENGSYNLDYQVYISDINKVGFNTYLEVKVNGEAYIENHEMNEDNYIIGTLVGLRDNAVVDITAYTTYYDELISIGSFNYEVHYPKGFESREEKYLATYNFDERSLSYTIDYSRGYVVSVDTNFDNSKDQDDKYQIKVYSSSESIIDPIKTTDKTISFVVPFTFNDISVEFNPIKERSGEDPISYDPISLPLSLALPYTGEYSFSDESISQGLDYYSGYTLVVSPEFNNNGNEYQGYRIEICDLEGNVLTSQYDSESSSDGMVLNVPFGHKKVVVKFVRVMKLPTGEILDYEPVEEEVELVEPFYNVGVNVFGEGYCLLIAPNSGLDSSEGDLTYNIIEHYKDGSTLSKTSTYTGTGEDIFQTDTTNITKIDVSIVNPNNDVIAQYVFDLGLTLEIGDYSIDSDGNIKIPYELTLPSGVTLDDNPQFSFSEGTSYDPIYIEDPVGEITITTLTGNRLEGAFYYSYTTKEGYKISSSIALAPIDFNSNIEVSYYGFYSSSVFYAYINAKDITEDGIEIDRDIEIEILNDGTYTSITNNEKVGIFYKVELEDRQIIDDLDAYRLTYRVDGGEDVTLAFESRIYDMCMSYYNPYNLNSFSIEPKYVYEINDNKANYYFLTGFKPNASVEETADLYERIEMTYTENGVTKTIFSPYFRDTSYVMENVPNKTYDSIKVSVYYKDDNDVYYNFRDGIAYKLDGNTNVISDTDSVTSDEDYENAGTYYTQVSFYINYDDIDKTKPFNVVVGNTSIPVPLKLIDDPDMVQDGDRYNFETNYNGIVIYVTINTESNVPKSYQIALSNIPGQYNTATLNYTFIAKDLLDAFEELNPSAYTAEASAPLGIFRSNYNPITIYDVTYSYSDNLATGYLVEINNVHVDEDIDSRDRLYYKVYDENGREISGDYLRNGNNTINVGVFVNKFTLKVFEAKRYHSDFPPVILDEIYEQEIDMSYLNIDPIDEENATLTYDTGTNNEKLGYSISVPINSGYEGNGYEINIIEYYKDGTSNSAKYLSNLSEITAAVDHSSDGLMANIDRIEIFIYYSDDSYNSSVVSVIDKTIE